MDPRLRAAVDTSLAWYDDIFCLHGIPTRTEGGLWWALAPAPPWHSGVKTTEPGVAVDRVVVIHGEGTVADSFGDVELASCGFTLLVDATWVHHRPLDRAPSRLPKGWSVVRDAPTLAEWNRAHDYAGVLLPAVLEHPAFTVVAREVDGMLAAGAVVHRGAHPGVVGLSNTWSTPALELDHEEVLALVATLHPGASVTDFAQGADLSALQAAGYTPLGPQRVWLRE